MKKAIFHPILFSLSPVLALLAANITEIAIEDTYRAFYAAILLCIASWIIVQLVLKDWHKAALVASVGLILFFSYGHIFSLVHGYSIGPILIGRTMILVPVWAIIMAVWTWYVIKRVTRAKEFTLIFNLVAFIFALFPIYTITTYVIQTEQARRDYQPEITQDLVETYAGTPPDVYYLILDMHARADVLEALYDYDLSWFTDALEERGFFIAEQSTSNYGSSLYSLSSSLNFKYLNYLEEQYEPDAETKEPLVQLINDNKVFQIFKQFGYHSVAFETGLYNTEIRDADIYIKPTPDQIKLAQVDRGLNSFEGILLESTLARVLLDLSLVQNNELPSKTIETPYKLHRLNIINFLSHLPELSQDNQPHIVFGHIICPHPPYVFGINGEELQHTEAFSFSGPGRVKGGEEEIRNYIDQLTYLDSLVLETIDDILRLSNVPPIIIIQADHGPNAYTSVDQVDKGNMKEQFAILNAYFFPDGNYSLLYPTITPVNSFRAIFNTYFDASYELLPDNSYSVHPQRRFEFIDVTERTKTDKLIP